MLFLKIEFKFSILSKFEESFDKLFKIGDYVTYRDIWNYENVNSRTRLDDTMFWDSVDLTGWRVVSYTNGQGGITMLSDTPAGA